MAGGASYLSCLLHSSGHGVGMVFVAVVSGCNIPEPHWEVTYCLQLSEVLNAAPLQNLSLRCVNTWYGGQAQLSACGLTTELCCADECCSGEWLPALRELGWKRAIHTSSLYDISTSVSSIAIRTNLVNGLYCFVRIKYIHYHQINGPLPASARGTYRLSLHSLKAMHVTHFALFCGVLGSQ